jgi:hypothetical protein
MLFLVSSAQVYVVLCGSQTLIIIDDTNIDKRNDKNNHTHKGLKGRGRCFLCQQCGTGSRGLCSVCGVLGSFSTGFLLYNLILLYDNGCTFLKKTMVFEWNFGGRGNLL